MKRFYYILLCLAGSLFVFNLANAQVVGVRLTVELPCSGIQKDSSVFLAGYFNHWNPCDSAYCMKRIDNRHYSLVIPCFLNKKYAYKYTLGSWASVEKAADGKDIADRIFTAGKRQKIKDEVIQWNRPVAAAPKDTSNLLNKKQTAFIMTLKDSMTKSLPVILPRLMGILQQVNTNLLADRPDASLSKQYNKEVLEIIAQIIDSLGNIMKQMVGILTPEQKQKIREAMKDPNAPKDMINLISKLIPESH